MSFGEKTIYKETKAVQWCKDGLVRELLTVSDKLVLAETKEDMGNLLKALSLDIQTLLDALETLQRSQEYYAKQEAENVVEVVTDDRN